MAKKIPAKSTKKKVAKKAVKKTSAKKTPAKKKVAPKKPAARKTPAKKAPTKKTVSKKAPTKKKAAPKKVTAASGKKSAVKTATTKKSVKKTSTTKSTSKKAAVKKAPTTKKAPAKKTVTKKTAVAKAPAKPKAAPKAAKATGKAALLKSRLSSKSKASKSAGIGFSLDEVKEIAKQSAADEAAVAKKKADKAKDKAAAIEAQLKAAKPSKVAAASLADILGFNPAASNKKSAYDDPADAPAKWRKYCKLLLELRTHLTGQIDQHSEETLKRSSKDDAGDLSSYGQHMADAGTDTFDRDFALSLVANEQEAAVGDFFGRFRVVSSVRYLEAVWYPKTARPAGWLGRGGRRYCGGAGHGRESARHRRRVALTKLTAGSIQPSPQVMTSTSLPAPHWANLWRAAVISSGAF